MKSLGKAKLLWQIIASCFIATLATAAIVSAATTIGTNINTGGALTVNGTNTLYGAANIGGAITATSTLNVTGLTTLGNASTTLLTSPDAWITKLRNLTANGFIKTGSSDGTLSIDTNTYLTALTGNSLTKGYFLVGNDAGLAQATSTIFISSSGNVGIGTTSPANKLHIVDNFSGVRQGILYENYGSGSAFISIHSQDAGGDAVFGWGIEPTKASWHLGAANSDGFLHVYQGSFGTGTEIASFTTTSGRGLQAPRGIYASDKIETTAAIVVGAGQYFGDTSRTIFRSASDGVMKISNHGETGFTRLQFGGTTSSFPALAVNSSDLQVIRADGSTAANLLVTGNLGIGTTTSSSLFTASAGSSATTTVEFGDQYSAASKSCFNIKTSAGASASFYFNASGIVFENNRCR